MIPTAALLPLTTFLLLAAAKVRGDSLADQCRDLSKIEAKWSEARTVCNEALQDRSKLEEGEDYHVLIARSKVFLGHYKNGRGDVEKAVMDLTEAIEMRPALNGPYWNRAEANLKLGNFVAARKDLERFDENPRLTDLRRQIDRAEMEMRLAREARSEKKWRSVAERTAYVIKTSSPYLKDAEKMRDEALLQMKDYKKALQLVKDAPQPVNPLLLAKLHFAVGDFSMALKQLSGTAKSENESEQDDEEKELVQLIRMVAGKFKEIDGMLLRPSITALESLSSDLSKQKNKNLSDLLLGAEQKISSILCLKYAKVKNVEKAVPLCQEMIRKDPGGLVDYSLSLAEVYGHQEKHDEVVKVLESALRLHPRDSRVQEALKAARKARHDAANPDYYKILGIARDASDKEIKLAYRRLAQKYHPDKVKSSTPEERKAAEEKMAMINRANDVLSDKTKRAQFDQGFDPENPQGSGNPFAGGHGGGGAGGQFFHFGGADGGGGGAGAGGFPFDFIFEAMQQQQGGGGGYRQQQQHHHQHQHQHQYRRQQHQDQFNFNFKDEL